MWLAQRNPDSDSRNALPIRYSFGDCGRLPSVQSSTQNHFADHQRSSSELGKPASCTSQRAVAPAPIPASISQTVAVVDFPGFQWKPDGERNEHGADPSASASRSRSVTRRGWGSDWPSESGHRDGSPQILRWMVMRNAIETWRRCSIGQWDWVVRRPPEERTNRHQLRVNCRGVGPDLSDQLFLAWHGRESGRYAIQCRSGCKTFSC